MLDPFIRTQVAQLAHGHYRDRELNSLLGIIGILVQRAGGTVVLDDRDLLAIESQDNLPPLTFLEDRANRSIAITVDHVG